MTFDGLNLPHKILERLVTCATCAGTICRPLLIGRNNPSDARG